MDSAVQRSTSREPRTIPASPVGWRVAMIVLILVPVAVVLAYAYLTQRQDGLMEWFKLFSVVVLSLFLPLLAYSYYFFRRERRVAEINRIVLRLDFEDSQYVEMFRSIHSGPYFVIAAGMIWVVTLAGLSVLYFGDKVWDVTTAGALGFPKPGSQLVAGMAFLGAYVWGLQYVFRRYVLNDLIPGVFFRLSIRMIMASAVALMIFNAFEALSSGGAPGAGLQEIKDSAWPAAAFVLGAFPQRGVLWLSEKIPFLAERPDPSMRHLPLEMIEGVDTYDRLRLEELGIDNCYDLAASDFVPLVFKSSYDARRLLDWILQAKLCVQCGDAVATLRQQGVRGILDLAELTEDEIAELANQTAATLSSLKRARRMTVKDADLARLRDVALQLGRFTRGDDIAPAAKAAKGSV